MPELKSTQNLAPCVNISKYIYYDLKRETNELAMSLIITKQSLFSHHSIMTLDGYLSQNIALTAENYIICITIKMTSQLSKTLIATSVDSIDTTEFSNR